jgi:putative FmdB family regulatory protein
MPTYEYHCDACEHDFEKFQSMSAEPIKVCPNCGKKKVRRLIGTGAGLIFKGSGFYITDYRDKGYAEKAKADSGGGETKPAESKTDAATPAATTESKPTEKKAEPKPAAEAPRSSTAKPASKKDKKK